MLLCFQNDNQFYKMMLDSRSEKSRIDVTFQNAGKVISMSSRGSSYNRIAFVEDRHSNRLSEFYYRNSMMHKVWHSELTDRIKEFVFTSVTYQNYLITEDNKIKLCCNRRMTLVKAPSGEEYKSLVLNAKRGSMYWISETSSEGKVMASSMDGKNVRKIYSSPKLHSIAYDDKVNKLYIAEVDAIMSLDLANNQVLTGITAKATRLSYANCALYFNDVSTNSIMVYKATTGLKKLVDVTNPDLPFIAAHENFFFTASPCSYAECTEYCLLSEGESEAIPRCVCPDCSNESGYGELEEKLDYIENDNTWNWSSIILAILFLFTLSALALEVRSGNVSVWCQWIVKRLDLRSSDDTVILFKKSNY
ncbi:hypothetical protein M3Y97_00923200 [Aphelenchoides bicaudatus]|nr:hypothetical protein M3Y97_00923200 [Aphelenchoides bicaudatus]